MSKKKSKSENEMINGKLFSDNEFDVVAVEDTPAVAEVECEAEPISPEPEKPKDAIKPKDPKLAILEEFAAIMRKYGRHGLVSQEIGEQIWNLWRAYTGRTDKWRRCSSCLLPKVHKMISECQRFNIPIR